MNEANTAFLVLASILVLFMTPGLAFFYGGLVSKRNVVNTMLSVFFITGLAILLWIICGYSLSFSGDHFGIIGNFHQFFHQNFDMTKMTTTTTKIPNGLYSLFEMMFAIITPALFVGAVVGRMKFKFLFLFIIGWSILVYYPMVHMVWSANGILFKLGTLDFAGGTVVHINAGITALVLSIFLGKRTDYHEPEHYNLPWVLLGTTILWIGWYGFNAGSAFGISTVAVQATMTTTVAAASAMISYMMIDVFRTGKPTLVGVCTGTLCGLVAITPACGYVTITGAFFIGIAGTCASYFFINYLKIKFGVDDTLDAFGAHGVSGIIGSVATGLFATKSVNTAVTHNGLFYGGGFKLLGTQLFATGFTVVFVAIMVTIITLGLKKMTVMRVSKQEERIGLDFSEHGERADYTISETVDSEVDTFRKEFQGQLAQLNNRKK
ncbi:ammonium transporter [Paucilactobacillus oligofermentans DSM 15707 = LMG 22743]|uniref:Ammonium transporter n=1 Tax=Paucilactobacillus oligofermentans DSM 15707 = LMG 22743 TaxID=1423778 RepID=A0A0R1RER2_9LACO|nr:ammonium transporter [Paucilactobacillus oligofermentans]KRL55552.1 ammonium transporter [Paucilactobacillus oligofermentans DSM 15707 = LMG 22743]CUS25460.1 Ammonium transporter [Paucilactobacillus oligofermentans DSM 15707 = LMG 22743]